MSRRRRGVPSIEERTQTLPDLAVDVPSISPPPVELSPSGEPVESKEGPPNGYRTKMGIIYTSSATGLYTHVLEAGEIVDDLGEQQAARLLELGAIEAL